MSASVGTAYLSCLLAEQLGKLPLIEKVASGSKCTPTLASLLVVDPKFSAAYFPDEVGEPVPVDSIVADSCATNTSARSHTRSWMPQHWAEFVKETFKRAVVLPTALQSLLDGQSLGEQRQRYQQSARLMRAVQLVQCAFGGSTGRRDNAAEIVAAQLGASDAATVKAVLLAEFSAIDLSAVHKWNCRVQTILPALVCYVALSDWKGIELRLSDVPLLDQFYSSGAAAARIALDCASPHTLYVYLQSSAYVRAMRDYLQLADRLTEDQYFPAHRRRGWSRLVLYWPNSYMHAARPAESSALYESVHSLLDQTELAHTFTSCDLTCLSDVDQKEALRSKALPASSPPHSSKRKHTAKPGTRVTRRRSSSSSSGNTKHRNQ